MAKELKIATQEDLLLLRKLILKDEVALRCWGTIVDHIVKRPVDISLYLRIKKLLDRHKYEEAVLMSLITWEGDGKDRADLMKVFEQLGLNSLIDRLMDSPLASPSGQHIQHEGATRTAQPVQWRKNCSFVVVLFTGASFCALAAVVISFLPSTTHVLLAVTNPKPEFIKPEIRGDIPEEGLKRLRDLVIKDSIALQKWSSVTDYIVTSPSDDLRIKKLIKDGHYEEAVLHSLLVWNSAGGRRADLVQILRATGLNLLADNILESISELS